MIHLHKFVHKWLVDASPIPEDNNLDIYRMCKKCDKIEYCHMDFKTYEISFNNEQEMKQLISFRRTQKMNASNVRKYLMQSSLHPHLVFW